MNKLIEKLLLSFGMVLVSIITLFVTNDLKVYAILDDLICALSNEMR